MNQGHNLYTFELNEVFTFFFIMLGPIKLFAPFAKLSAANSAPERRSLALRGTLLATLTVLVASFLGRAMLQKWQVSPGALAIAGGILFLLVALPLVLQSYSGNGKQQDAAAASPAPASRAQVQRLVPMIVSPYGIAAVILLLTLMPDQVVSIVAILAGIMVLDLLAMLFAKEILAVIAFPLQIVGTVMGVLQVALSVEMIIYGVKLVAMQRFGMHL